MPTKNKQKEPVKIRPAKYYNYMLWRVKNKVLDTVAKLISPLFPSQFQEVGFINGKPIMVAEYKTIFGRKRLINTKNINE